MTPQTKGFLSLVGVVGISAAVVLLVLSRGSRTGTGSSGGPGVNPNGIELDNGAQANADPLRPDYRVELLSIPAFSQPDQQGRIVTNDAFKDNLTVVSFFFTRCTFICPALTGRMLELTGHLKDTPTKFMSFSVDPENDTPEVLAEYAKNHNADVSRWSFLSGKREVTWGILRDGLKWGIEERPEERINLPNGSSMSNIRHPGWVALVGPDGRVLGIYQSSDEEQMKALEKRVRDAMKRMGKR